MVDVGQKEDTRRSAIARTYIKLPTEILQHLQDNELNTKKGPVFQTASLAGIMAAKNTSQLIPLCHPLSLDKCDVEIIANEGGAVIQCEVSTHGKTGVEMEALTGASVAALTIYDMCKSFGHEMIITETKLISKTGGKSDYHAE